MRQSQRQEKNRSHFKKCLILNRVPAERGRGQKGRGKSNILDDAKATMAKAKKREDAKKSGMQACPKGFSNGIPGELKPSRAWST